MKEENFSQNMSYQSFIIQIPNFLVASTFCLSMVQ